MIELNKKTQQDFLNRKWVQKLLDAGVDMSDAKYHICHISIGNNEYKDYVTHKDSLYDIITNINLSIDTSFCLYDEFPTYTVSELLYKLHEWIYPTIDGKQFSGGLKFCKDAPFYIFYYALKTKDYVPNESGEYNEEYIYAEAEYPIESLAMLLIQCHKKDIGIKTKDTGDISNK